MGRDVQLFSKRTKKSEKSSKITRIEKDGDDLQSGVIKNDYTPGIKEGRDQKKVSSLFVLKKNTDCE